MPTGAEILANRFSEETRDENKVIDREAIVKLAEDDLREFINLDWNTGKVGSARGRRTKKRLYRGQSIRMPLDRAVGHFGPFMIPRDSESELDDNRLQEMIAFFTQERSRVLMAWGDYPRPLKLAEGNAPVGPSRFPHVIVTVIDPEGEESEPFDLHQVFGVGEHDAISLRPSTFKRLGESGKIDRAERMEAENRELRERLARLEGATELLVAERNAPNKKAS